MSKISKKRTETTISLAAAVSRIDPAIVALYTDMRADVRTMSAVDKRRAEKPRRRAVRRPRTVVGKIVKWLPAAACLCFALALFLPFLLTVKMGGAEYGGSNFSVPVVDMMPIKLGCVPSEKAIESMIEESGELVLAHAAERSGIDVSELRICRRGFTTVTVDGWCNYCNGRYYNLIIVDSNNKIVGRVIARRSLGQWTMSISELFVGSSADVLNELIEKYPGEDIVMVDISGSYAAITSDNKVHKLNPDHDLYIDGKYMGSKYLSFPKSLNYYKLFNIGTNTLNASKLK